ncbi:MAG TPA: hypothetical protein VGI10_04225 [Polyangiaceae bacterium]|jgi:hypothetical protein
MQSTQSPSKSRLSAWLVGAAGVIALCAGIRSQLGHPSQAKHHALAASDDTLPSPGTTPMAAGRPSLAHAPGTTAPAKVSTADMPRNIDSATYIDKRYPNQAAPEIVMLKLMTPEEKEQKLREMFPDYDALQANAEAERARLGIKN